MINPAKFVSLVLLVGAFALAGTPSGVAADVLTECYELKFKGAKLEATGNDLLTALNNTAKKAFKPRKSADHPNDPKQCGNPQKGSALAKATSLKLPGAVYYGKIDTPLGFQQMTEVSCGGGVAHQFFSLQEAIFYRDCSGGRGNGYVYFWGLTEGKPSQCVTTADYPTMYAEANKGRKNVTVDDLFKVATKGQIGSNYALGNAMAAILVAEAWRDYNLRLLNYMLLDLMKEKSLDAEVYMGGLCPPVDQKLCQNKKQQKKKGIHPLAWGGAQSAMMAG